MRRIVPLAAAILLVAAAPAYAATRTITIGSAFTPSVLVVSPGTTLVWHNADGQAHSFSGDVNSNTIPPGASTAPRVINRQGQYHYALAGNGAVKGTIIVTRAAPRPHVAPGPPNPPLPGHLPVTLKEKFPF